MQQGGEKKRTNHPGFSANALQLLGTLNVFALMSEDRGQAEVESAKFLELPWHHPAGLGG